MSTSTPEDQLAAYVLGNMDDAERSGFEAMLASDPQLAEEARRLAEALAELDGTVEPASVPDHMWSAIAARIDDTPQRTPANAVPAPGAARPAATPVPGLGMRRAVIAASIAAAGLVGFLAASLTQPPPAAPIVIAVLNSDDAVPGAIVEAFGDDSIRLIPLEELVAPEGQVLEVWTLPSAEMGPVSLGTFERATDLRLVGPDLPTPQSEQLYEITLEPAGGSPTGRPTGPILLKGLAREPVL